jgi:Fur family transcriptional regulator, ferric uptake regulator
VSTPPLESNLMASTEPQRWTEQALAALADAGYRRGGARREVVELLGGQACALSAQEIETALAAGRRRVSRASIYRILEELEALRLVQRVEAGSGTARYEPVRSGGHHHHHLVCDHCGQLQPFSDERLERAIEQLAKRVPLSVTEHEVMLHGACERCAS